MAISAMSTGRRSFPLEEGHLPTIKLSREVLFFLRTLEGLDGVLFAAEGVVDGAELLLRQRLRSV